MRLERKKTHDEKNCIRDTELIARDFVLLRNTRREKYMSIKLSFKWLGPYQIFEVVKNKSTYMLEELDGTRLAGTFAGDRLKIFHPHQELLLGNFAAEIDHERIPDLIHLLSQPKSETDDDLSDALSSLDYILGSDSETLSDVPDYFSDL